MAEKIEYHSGKMTAYVQVIAGLLERNPSMRGNIDYLMANLRETFPELKDRTQCPNCDASMKSWIYTLDAWDALLVIKMAEEVDKRLNKGMNFTIANQVRVPDLPTTLAIKCRTTQCAKLGLVAQLKNSDGARVQGVWVITKRGFDALGGKEVPAKVRVWRKRIEERFEETTTFALALNSHKTYVENRLAAGKKPRADFREDIARYDQSRWLNWQAQEGRLF